MAVLLKQRKSKRTSIIKFYKPEDMSFAACVLLGHNVEQIFVQNANREIDQKGHWVCMDHSGLQNNFSTF